VTGWKRGHGKTHCQGLSILSMQVARKQERVGINVLPPCFCFFGCEERHDFGQEKRSGLARALFVPGIACEGCERAVRGNNPVSPENRHGQGALGKGERKKRFLPRQVGHETPPNRGKDSGFLIFRFHCNPCRPPKAHTRRRPGDMATRSRHVPEGERTSPQQSRSVGRAGNFEERILQAIPTRLPLQRGIRNAYNRKRRTVPKGGSQRWVRKCST
jgi:hypothetical protein